jgi:hypothetical protein
MTEPIDINRNELESLRQEVEEYRLKEDLERLREASTLPDEIWNGKFLQSVLTDPGRTNEERLAWIRDYELVWERHTEKGRVIGAGDEFRHPDFSSSGPSETAKEEIKESFLKKGLRIIKGGKDE